MSAVSVFVLCFSGLLCAAQGGILRFAVCAVLCLLFCLLSPLLPQKPPVWLRPLLLPGMLFLLFPLWPLLFAELGEFRAPILFALVLLSALCLTAGKQAILHRASLPVGALALLCSLCTFAGEWDTAAAEPVFSAVGALVCPLAAGLLFPSVLPRKKQYRVLFPAVSVAVICALPVLLFRNALCECSALLFICPLCASAELRAFCGKEP